MAIIDTTERVVHLLDSMNAAHAWAQEVCERLILWVVRDSIEKEHAKRELVADKSGWTHCVEVVPYQTNGQDCGVFVLPEGLSVQGFGFRWFWVLGLGFE